MPFSRPATGAFYWPIALISHGLGSDLCQVEEHIAEARRMVHRQKVVFRPPASAHGMPLWLLESNLRQLEKHRARLRESSDRQQT